MKSKEIKSSKCYDCTKNETCTEPADDSMVYSCSKYDKAVKDDPVKGIYAKVEALQKQINNAVEEVFGGDSMSCCSIKVDFEKGSKESPFKMIIHISDVEVDYYS